MLTAKDILALGDKEYQKTIKYIEKRLVENNVLLSNKQTISVLFDNYDENLFNKIKDDFTNRGFIVNLGSSPNFQEQCTDFYLKISINFDLL